MLLSDDQKNESPSPGTGDKPFSGARSQPANAPSPRPAQPEKKIERTFIPEAQTPKL